MIILVIFTALPLVYMVSTAFKPLDELFLFPPTFFVRKPSLQNFTSLFASMSGGTIPITRYIFNSVFTTVITVTGTVLICSMGAYSLEKLRVPGHEFLFKIVIVGLMFVPPVAQIPIYIVMSKLGFLNTYYALIVPNLAAPMYLFLMKQFISQLPDVLLESARIDGAGELRIYWKLVMPMIKPAWSTVVVFSFIANWNNSSSSIVYITDQAMKTLPYALTSIGSGTIGAVGAMSAASLLVTIPTIVVYLMMQKKVLNTMAYAGIKG